MTLGGTKSEKIEHQDRQKWAQGTKSEPKGTKSEPKVSQREPKVSQREPKGRQREPKGAKREPKGRQKWAKGRPKCIKKSTFGKGREKVAKKIAARTFRRTILGAIFHQKSMKKTMRKSIPKKSWNLMKCRCENEPKFRYLFKTCVHIKTNFFEKGEIVYTLAGCSRMHVGEGFQKKIKSKKWEKYQENLLQKRSRKRDGKSMKKPSKSDPKRR